ncbi:conserved exported hypothetical protein [Crenothrix polyspora]|jgi:hypothetical protein|uniref:DUF2845 domain-containing protein n=1 Tax=Crenothrix polyspora TaxID=360316 RepID=A0A1R4H4V3_9GAMM|nr:DUF2845 domain-containing protein [Crenothrix polyspora]SJM91061.1 conserved exported hypothetical protein [Crenothrix polyspora]
MKALHRGIFLLCLLFSQPLFALRCDSWVVEPGDSKQDIYDACGEPDFTDFHYERRGNNNYAEFGQYYNNQNRQRGGQFNYGQQNFRVVEVLVEEWTYDFGHSRLRQHLRFENGRLKEVTDMGRGRRR